MNLYIFEPCPKWDYCGGMVLCIAETLEDAIEKVHRHLRDEIIERQKYKLQRTRATVGTSSDQDINKRYEKMAQELELELEQQVKLPHREFLVEYGAEFIAECRDNCRGNHWTSSGCVPTTALEFPGGGQVRVNYNYA